MMPKSREKFKCKLKDLIHDLHLLGVTNIRLCSSGVGAAVIDNLRYDGISVEEYR